MDASSAAAECDAPSGVDDDPLWQAISAYDFDGKDAVLTFRDRLAREQGWPSAFADAAIGEYRRFCYLARKADNVVVPSDEIDQVWHLHLLFSEDYWDVFCARVLGRKFHHTPAQGGALEADDMRRNYAKTLRSYEAVFGAAPPRALWPETADRFKYPRRHRRVDMVNYVVIPRLDKPKRIGLMVCIVGLIVAIWTL